MSPRGVRTAAASSALSSPRMTVGSVVAASLRAVATGAGVRRHARQRAIEHALANLGGAAAAEHPHPVLHQRELGRRLARRCEHLEPAHEAAIDPVLETHHPAALERETPLAAERGAVAEIQQREEVALWRIASKRAAFEKRGQVVVEVRAFAHGVDACFRRRRVLDQGGAVADREQVVVALHLQCRARQNEATAVGLETGLAKQCRPHPTGHPDQQVEPHFRAIGQRHRRLAHSDDWSSGADLDAAVHRLALDPGREPVRPSREDARAIVQQGHLVLVDTVPAQPLSEREGELDATDAAAHDHDPGRGLGGASGNLFECRVDVADERTDRSRRQRVLLDSRELEARHRRADVDRSHVVADRGTAFDRHAPGARIDRGRAPEHDASACPSRQRNDVDLELVRRVLPGDEPRHHPRVRRDRHVDHDGDTRVARRLHREPPQHLNVRVAAADEHDVSGGGHARPRPATPPPASARYRSRPWRRRSPWADRRLRGSGRRLDGSDR